MNIQSQSALLAAFVNLLLAVSIMVRWRWRSLFFYYAGLALVLASWSFTNFMVDFTASEPWELLASLAAALIPITALKFFQALLADRSPLSASASRFTLSATVILIIALIPLREARWLKIVLFVYVFATLYLCVYLIWKRLREDTEPSESAKMLAMTIGGLVVITLSLADFVPTLKGAWPALGNIPVLGNVVIMFFMFFLYQIVVEVRLLALSELVGKIAVLAALVMILAAIYGVLAVWIGDQPSIFGFYTLIVSFVMLILFEPMKEGIEERVNRMLFRERFEFARQLDLLRREMANMVELRDLADLVISKLKETRRVTHASLYLLEDDAISYRLFASVGEAPEYLDAVKERLFLERLSPARAMTLLEFEDEIEERRRSEGQDAETEDLEYVCEVMRQLNTALSVAIMSDERVIGLLNVNDDRIKEAYTYEEIRALIQIANQAAISIENSHLVDNLREKDRLAALGEMAAGLAHEIRNPLGAIKGAAQLLDLPEDPTNEEEESQQVFLDIILEEVGRLNKVVAQFLDYARPYRGTPRPCKVNDVVERTSFLFQQKADDWGVRVELHLADGLPEARVDPELLRQVFLNLAINAIHAAGTPPPSEEELRDEDPNPIKDASLLLYTANTRRLVGIGGKMVPRDMIEVRFIDNGRGIPEADQDRVFIPFFTTKQKGTGLGLAISQRIVENFGGRLDFTSKGDRGTTFRVLLPLFGSGS